MKWAFQPSPLLGHEPADEYTNVLPITSKQIIIIPACCLRHRILETWVHAARTPLVARGLLELNIVAAVPDFEGEECG